MELRRVVWVCLIVALSCVSARAGDLRTDAQDLTESAGAGSVSENLKELSNRILSHKHDGTDGSSELGGVLVSTAGVFVSSGATGSQSITGFGFTPRLVFFSMGVGAADSIMAGSGWATADFQVAVFGFRVDDGGLSGGLSTNTGAVIRWCGVDGVVRGQASRVSLDPDGVTLSWSAADPQTIAYWAIR